jgi:hypothetical protein
VNRERLFAHFIHPAVNLVTILVGSGFHFARLANYFGIASTAEDFSMSAAEYAYEFEHLTKPLSRPLKKSFNLGLYFYFCGNINQDLNLDRLKAEGRSSLIAFSLQPSAYPPSAASE